VTKKFLNFTTVQNSAQKINGDWVLSDVVFHFTLFFWVLLTGFMFSFECAKYFVIMSNKGGAKQGHYITTKNTIRHTKLNLLVNF
jgi:hypothetical protein